MAGRTKITQATYDQALAAEVVRAGVEQKARRVFLAAKTQAYAAGRKNMGDLLRLETGRRPGAKAVHGGQRPYGRIISELTEQQQAQDARVAKLSRTKILRRSIRG